MARLQAQHQAKEKAKVEVGETGEVVVTRTEAGTMEIGRGETGERRETGAAGRRERCGGASGVVELIKN